MFLNPKLVVYPRQYFLIAVMDVYKNIFLGLISVEKIFNILSINSTFFKLETLKIKMTVQQLK